MNDFEIIEQQVTQVNEDIKTFKSGLANALNVKGVPTSAKDSTTQIIANIGKIEGGGSGGELISGTKIPSDMLLPPQPNKTFTNDHSNYKTYGAAWCEPLKGFLIAGENFGDNISLVKLDGIVERHDFPELKLFYYDKIDNCMLIVQNVSGEICIKKLGLDFNVQWTVYCLSYGNSEIFEIKRFNNNYYVLTGRQNTFDNCHVIKINIYGDVICHNKLSETLYDSVYTNGFYVDYENLIVRTSNHIFILDSNTLKLKFQHDAPGIYNGFGVFKSGDMYLIEQGYGMITIMVDNLGNIEQDTMLHFYYPTYIKQLDEFVYFTICKDMVRILRINPDNYYLDYEEKEQIKAVKITTMKDGNYLCEYDDFKMMKLDQQFNMEWKADSYGTENWVGNNSYITNTTDFVHEQGDYIYYVRKGAVLELDFVPSYTIK